MFRSINSNMTIVTLGAELLKLPEFTRIHLSVFFNLWLLITPLVSSNFS